MFISSNTKYLREKKGLTQDELAALVGVTQNAISKIEKGLTLNPRFILELASILEVPSEVLKNTDLVITPVKKLAANLQSRCSSNNYSLSPELEKLLSGNNYSLSPELEKLLSVLLKGEQEGSLSKKQIEALTYIVMDKKD